MPFPILAVVITVSDGGVFDVTPEDLPEPS